MQEADRAGAGGQAIAAMFRCPSLLLRRPHPLVVFPDLLCQMEKRVKELTDRAGGDRTALGDAN